MPKVTLADELTHLTEGVTYVDTPGTATVKACLLQLFCTYPQLYLFLQSNHAEESQRILLILNDEELLEYGDVNRVLTEDDSLYVFYGVPHGRVEAATQFLATYMAEATAQMVVQGVITAVATIALSVVISAIMGALVDDISNPESAIASNSATYTFDGIKNTTASGTPIGIVYGLHRCGGQILNLFTRHPTEITTDLYYQIGLSEGEIVAISDVEINRLPSTYYNGVDPLTVRLGSSSQAVMAEFSKIPSTTSTNRKVLPMQTTPPQPAVINTDTVPVYGAVVPAGDYGDSRVLKEGAYIWSTYYPPEPLYTYDPETGLQIDPNTGMPVGYGPYAS